MLTNTTKPTYSMSASLINKLKWLNTAPDNYKESAKEQLVKAVRKEYTGNTFTQRGVKFEDTVIAREHSVLNRYVDTSDTDIWYNKVIDFGAFDIRLSGKFDLLSHDKQHIYDIKRITRLYNNHFRDDKTVQHNMYMYLCDTAKDFTYLIVTDGDRKDSLQYYTEKYERPENLENIIYEEVNTFLLYLVENDLIQDYKDNYTYISKYTGSQQITDKQNNEEAIDG